MNKNIIIESNENNNNNYFSINILYLVLFCAIIYLIYKFIYSKNKTEHFENCLTNNNNSTLINQLKESKEEINYLQDKILKSIEEHDKSTYISKNFNKINPDSFDKELEYIDSYFKNNNLPRTDLARYKLITSQGDLDKLIFEASTFKNIYKPGEIVNTNSTFDIDKNKICYQNKNILLKNDPNFISNHPECMVCSINPPETYDKTNSWFNTKTNIKEVCLFKPNSSPNSGIPNLDDCKKFCSIQS
jgi:hypothetical protein